MYKFFAGLFFLFFIIQGNLVNCSSAVCQNLTISLMKTENDFSIIDTFGFTKIFIEKIEYSTDIKMSVSDWKDITGLSEKKYLEIKDLKNICLSLKRKNKFEKLTISLEKGISGYILKFNATSYWTFNRLIFKGNISDKQIYLQKYLISGSEFFDISKHKYSIEAIKQEFYDNGYCNIVLKDTIDYDNTTKEVTVTLNVEKMDKFKINNINFTFEYPASFEFKKEIEESIAKLFINKIKGQDFNKENINSMQKEILNHLALQGYLNTQITMHSTLDKEKKNININFKISILSLKKFIFLGNTFFSTKELLEELLIPDSFSLLVPPALLVEDIMELYKNKGYWNVIVNFREEKNNYIFNIVEKNPIKIKEISFKNIKDKEKILEKIFTEFCTEKQFDSEIFNDSINKLITEYIRNGYWDFNVEKKEFVSLGADVYKIELTVNLGKQRFLKSVKIPQFDQLEKEEIFKPYTNLKKPIPFDMQIIHEQKDWLLKYFKSKGFLYSNVKPELVFDNDAKNLICPNLICTNLIWNIDNNLKKVFFGKTIVEGGNRISSSILLRELQYKEGEVFDNVKIEASNKKLRQLSIFESISLRPVNNEAGNYKTMLLKYTPDFPFEVRARAGYQQVSKSFTHQSGSTYKFGGSFLWKNPLYIADKLRADIDFTRFIRNISLSYEMPWIFNQPIRTLIKFYSILFEQPPFTGSHARLYKASQEGLALDFNRAFNGGVFNLCTGVEWQKLYDMSDRLARIIQFEPALIDKKTAYFCFAPSLELEYRDNKLEPTKGGNTILSAKCMWTPYVKEASYLKLNFEQSFFYPLYKKCVIGATRFAVGHIFNQKFNTILPIERFYLGGSSTLRGYETDMVPPLNSFIGSNLQRYWVPIGGKSMLNINTEIRFPIYSKLSGVVFTDAGALTDTKISDIRGNSIYAASGFGVRYSTPFGPIRFDIGFKWKKRTPQDRSYAWFLTFGHTF